MADDRNGADVDSIFGDRVPLGAFSETGVWSLLNLICMLGGVVVTAVLLVHFFLTVRRKDNTAEAEAEAEAEAAGKEVDEDQKPAKRWQTVRWISALIGLVQLMCFLILEDIRLPMALLNHWTPLFLVLMAVQVVTLIIFAVRGYKFRKTDDSEEEAASGTTPATQH